MDLAETYKAVHPTIVAFVPKYFPGPNAPEFPPIIGTGFVVDEGLVATNDHVVRVFGKIPKPPDLPPEEWPVLAFLFHWLPSAGMAGIPLEVLGVFRVGQFKVDGYYYGPYKPDIAFVHVKARGLPRLQVNSKAIDLEPGGRVATAGFTMGTDALRAPGWMHQFTPTLQEGIISAVLPFPCSTPHAVVVNIMTQGGASGSPVFAVHEPVAIGVLYGGLVDLDLAPGGQRAYRAPTNFSLFAPGHYLESSINTIRASHDLSLPEGTLTLKQMVETMPRSVAEKQAHLKAMSRTGILAMPPETEHSPELSRLDPGADSGPMTDAPGT